MVMSNELSLKLHVLKGARSNHAGITFSFLDQKRSQLCLTIRKQLTKKY